MNTPNFNRQLLADPGFKKKGVGDAHRTCFMMTVVWPSFTLQNVKIEELA